MASWSQRLQTLHKATEAAGQGSDHSSMSLEELWSCKLGFGKTHAKKTYGDIWLNHQNYVQWFLDHHTGGQMPQEHKKFQYFCHSMIERAELEGVAIRLTKDGNNLVPGRPVTGGVFPMDNDEEQKEPFAIVESLTKRIEDLEAKVAALQSIIQDDVPTMIVMQ